MSVAAKMAGRFAADHVRNGANLLVLIAVPATFVVIAADTLADAAQILGGNPTAIATVTAGWAAGFVSAVGTYFLVAGNRDPDRRLVISGLSRRTLVVARIVTALLAAAVASTTSLIALAARTGIDDAVPVVTGTIIFAVIYAGFGALAGALFRDPVNGTVAILFVWMLDVFFGPALTGIDRIGTRLLPSHFVSLWMTGQESGHSLRMEDLAWSVGWMGTALVASAWVLSSSTRQSASLRGDAVRRSSPQMATKGDAIHTATPALRPIHRPAAAALEWGLRDWQRLRLLWFLLAAVPAVFVLLSDAITPPGRMNVFASTGGRMERFVVDPASIHAGTMAPSGIAALSMLAAVFIALDTAKADRRLIQAGMAVHSVTTARLATIGVAALAATASSLAMAALVFRPANWGGYTLASLMVAVTFGLLGMLLAPIMGRVGAVLMSFLIPFLDLGLSQSPMLRPQPADWAHALPGYGSMRILVDASVTTSIGDWTALATAIAWIAALLALVIWRSSRVTALR